MTTKSVVHTLYPRRYARCMTTQMRDGRSTRWDPHRRERRQTIIDAAIAAIEESGPDVLTAEIAERAGVPRTHVYRHFEGKQALDFAVSRQLSRQIGEQIRRGLATGSTPRGLIRGAIDEHLGWIEAHPNLYRFLALHAYAVDSTGARASDDAKAAFATELTTLLSGYMTALHLDTSRAESLMVGVVGMVDATGAWWVDRHEVPRAELTDALTDQVWLILAHEAKSLGLDLDPEIALPPLAPQPEPSDAG